MRLHFFPMFFFISKVPVMFTLTTDIAVNETTRSCSLKISKFHITLYSLIQIKMLHGVRFYHLAATERVLEYHGCYYDWYESGCGIDDAPRDLLAGSWRNLGNQSTHEFCAGFCSSCKYKIHPFIPKIFSMSEQGTIFGKHF